jgi:hypothetical protein
MRKRPLKEIATAVEKVVEKLIKAIKEIDRETTKVRKVEKSKHHKIMKEINTRYAAEKRKVTAPHRLRLKAIADANFRDTEAIIKKECDKLKLDVDNVKTIMWGKGKRKPENDE